MVKDITGPTLVNGIVKFMATWDNAVIPSLSIHNYDLSKYTTDELGSFGLTKINTYVSNKGHSGFEVSFCDSPVEVKDLGIDLQSHAKNLVINKWGKQEGRKIWKQQLRFMQRCQGSGSTSSKYSVTWIREGRIMFI